MVGYGTDSAREATDAQDTLQFLAESVSRQYCGHFLTLEVCINQQVI
jgi:hypothetical protein